MIWAAGAGRQAAFRLRPGTDLRGGIEAAFADSGASAGHVIAAVGSLDGALLRLAARDEGSPVDGPLEIIALSGTLGPDGVHLHISVADGTGAMTGGHLLAGCRVRTTAEIVLGLTDAVAFRRRHDPETGHAELVVTGPGSDAG